MNESVEIWKPIPGFKNYEVSNWGRVKSKNGLLCLQRHKKGYLRVKLSRENRSKTYIAHRLVAITFIDNPNNLPQVNHKDENKSNNHVSNLEWCTCEYNNNYGSRNRRLSQNHNYMSVKKTDYNAIGIKLSKKVTILTSDGIFIKTFDSIREASEQTSHNASCIVQCCKGKQKTSKGYIWRYAE